MAIFIPIRKQSEDGQSAIYEYGVEVLGKPITTKRRSRSRLGESEYIYGQFRIVKQSGAVEIIKLAPGDEDQRLFGRAARKIFLHWQEGKFPETTCWAS